MVESQTHSIIHETETKETRYVRRAKHFNPKEGKLIQRRLSPDLVSREGQPSGEKLMLKLESPFCFSPSNMKYRMSIPVDLPTPNPTSSCWQDPPSPLSAHRTPSLLPSTASIVVVGSGITGASLSYDILKQPSPPSVLTLEARIACSGATGRNGGHTKCASYRAFMDNICTLSEDQAAKIARLEYNCMKSVHMFAKEKSIECDSWEGDTVDIIYDNRQWKEAKTAVSEIKRLLGSNDPAARYTFGIRKRRRIIFDQRCYSSSVGRGWEFQPIQICSGLARVVS